MSDIHSHVDLFSLKGKAAADGYLSDEIAAEGVKVTDGEDVTYAIPSSNLVIPDLSKVKRLQKYFFKRGYEAWPAWLYHPTKAAVLVKDQEEGFEYGVYYRETTADERMRMGGQKSIWDWKSDTLWRPMPYDGTQKADVKAYGKELIASAPNYLATQNDLLRGLADAMSKSSAAGSKQMQQFMEAFMAAFVKSGGSLPVASNPTDAEMEACEAAVEALDPDTAQALVDADAALSAISESEERAIWKAEAEKLGVKVDGRWSLERLKTEVNKVA